MLFSLNKYSLGLFYDTLKYAQTLKQTESIAYLELNLKDIISVDFPIDQYFKEQTTKNQIVLHHTVSGQGTAGDIAWWRQTADRVGTAIIVGFDGKIYQCFSTKYWAHHLGMKSPMNLILNKSSIGIEIDSWGGLVELNGKWYPAKWDTNLKKNVPNVSVKPIQNVEKYPNGFKGYYGYEKYTDEQVEAVRKLLVYWHGVYGIPLTYNEDMWALSPKAIKGTAGVWAHVSFREDKSDCHPAPNLIQMLKSL